MLVSVMRIWEVLVSNEDMGSVSVYNEDMGSVSVCNEDMGRKAECVSVFRFAHVPSVFMFSAYNKSQLFV